MATTFTLTLDACDRDALARFWSAALDYVVEWSVDTYTCLAPTPGDGPKLLLQQVPEAKSAKNRLHLDLHLEDFEARADRMVELGARRVTDGVVWHARTRHARF